MAIRLAKPREAFALSVALAAAAPGAAHDVGHQEDNGEDRHDNGHYGDIGGCHDHTAIVSVLPGFALAVSIELMAVMHSSIGPFRLRHYPTRRA